MRQKQMNEEAAKLAVEAGAVAVLLPAYACRCARCGWAWMSQQCDCRAHASGVGRRYHFHDEDCAPPPRCPGCKAPHWERPGAWVRGEGTSKESLRRRAIAARVARETRRKARLAKKER